MEVRAQLAEALAEANDFGPRDPRMGGEQPKAKEGKTVPAPIETAFAGMEREAIAVQELADLVVHFVELFLAVREQQEVIDVAGIGARAEVANDQVVHGVEIDVGEELGCLVAERQSAAAVVRREEGIAGEVVEDLVAGVGTGDEQPDEAEGVGAVDYAGREILKNLMVK